MADPAPATPVVADPFTVYCLVAGELVDNMSSLSPGDSDFYVDRLWALQLIEAVTGERPDELDELEADDEEESDDDLADDRVAVIEVRDGAGRLVQRLVPENEGNADFDAEKDA